MTILKDINEALSSLQQPRINTIESSSDGTSIIMTSLANQLSNLISIDTGWQSQNKVKDVAIEESFEGVDCYDLTEIDDFSNIENLFIWDVKTQLRLHQVSYDRYLYEKTREVQRTNKTYCFAGNKILFSTPYTEETILRFVYKSDTFVKKADGTYTREYLLDNDESIFPNYLIVQGLRWKWYDNKNLPNTDRERALFYDMMDKYENRDRANMIIDFSDAELPRRTEDQGVRYE